VLLGGRSIAARTFTTVEPEELMESVFEVIGQANLKMCKGPNLIGFLRDPAEPLAKTPDVCIDGKARPVQAEQNYASRSLDTNAVVLNESLECLVSREGLEML
jgi:hypothetical protein